MKKGDILADFLRTNIVAILALLFAIISFIISIRVSKKQRQPDIKVDVIGLLDFKKKINYHMNVDLYNRFIEQYPIQHRIFINIKSSLGDQRFDSDKSGFCWNTRTISKDSTELFIITSENVDRTIEPLASIVEFKCDNVNVKKLKINRITVTWPQKLKPKAVYINRRKDIGGKKIEASYLNPFLSNSSLYILIFEVYDENDGSSWLCKHKSEKDSNWANNILYEKMIIHFTMTSTKGEKTYVDAKVEVVDGIPRIIDAKIRSNALIKSKKFFRKFGIKK